jgi:hypothetical protein
MIQQDQTMKIQKNLITQAISTIFMFDLENKVKDYVTNSLLDFKEQSFVYLVFMAVENSSQERYLKGFMARIMPTLSSQI